MSEIELTRRILQLEKLIEAVALGKPIGWDREGHMVPIDNPSAWTISASGKPLYFGPPEGGQT